jgi:hypothetical protein
MVFQDGNVVEIDVKILDGPCGTVGFWIGAGGSQYVPRTNGSFIIPNDDYFTWPLANAINSGSWQLTGYNLDSFPHLIQVAFQVNETGISPALTTGTVGVGSDTVTQALSQTVPPIANQPDPLSADALINSTPAGSTVTSFASPVDLAALEDVSLNGAP